MTEMNEQNQIPASKEQSDALDEALGLQAVSFRIPKATHQAIKEEAEKRGVTESAMMRFILSEWEGLRQWSHGQGF
ncbi:hypothetical protein [Delftia phage PhiW-14]|uniref:Uncharacterized protein n=1 Tax=Delftia phage PhiW-14 TaxID=665032 RepID=C9DG68_BPW14|nr:hypothetical protein DP-phiW-14_gp098 [Delftia phage PhiW-14]ACV50119.1 hypothetical protein [Delftia phage PhiW-14]